jgi:RimJ/RimL family protein N-acetyltransferase
LNRDLNSKEDIVSDRLILYRPRQDHLQSIYEIHANPDTNQFNPLGSMQNMMEAVELLQHWQLEWTEKQWGYWSIALGIEPDRIVGVGGISNRPRFGGKALVERLSKENAANLYIRFRPEAWGSGYASEMAEMALEMAFNQIGLKAVLGITRESNMPSRRALERLGLKFVEQSIDNHELGPQLIYSIDSESYAIQRCNK